MPETVQACPLCGTAQDKQIKSAALFDQRNLHGFQVTNQLCAKCGLVYQSPRMTEVELEAFYESEYRKLYQGSAGPSPKDLAVQADRAQALVEFAQKKIMKVERHLDIGCSAGLLLLRFQQEYTCLPTGVEPGEAYRQYAQAQGMDVYSSLTELEACQSARYDLISLAHVLEHIPEPVKYLADLRGNWLSPGGWLLVEVPNLYGHDCFEIAHLVSYSPHTLQQVLQQAKFQVQFVEVHGRPRSELIPLYITILAQANPVEKIPEIEPEGGVRQKRQAAMLRRKMAERLSPRKAWLPIPIKTEK